MIRAIDLSVLKDLIETSNDGERGFALAAKDNREPDVAEVLKDGEESFRVAGIELRDQMRLLGGATEESGPVKRSAYRGWVNFNVVPIFRDTKSILEDCERGEDYARRSYQAAVKLELPEPARLIVERHYQRVIAIHDRLRLLRNRYPATTLPRAIGSRSENRRQLVSRQAAASDTLTCGDRRSSG